MDPTTQALLAALVGAVVAGGAVLAWHVSERRRSRAPQRPEPPVHPEVAAVLSVLRSSAVVVDDSGAVVKASTPAYAMGLVRGTQLLDVDLAGLVRDVRRDGQIRETELTVARRGGPPRHVTARVAPLGSRLVLALLEDRTPERRVEAVRRDFVANVSHELKTPVGAVRLLAEAVHEAADDPAAVRRFAGRMRTESDRLTGLVQQVIELSRLQGDEPLESPVPVALDDVIATAVDTTAMAAAAKQITVLPGGTPGLRVLGNEEQVAVAVTNLVANAVAYSEPGSTVLVTTRSGDGPGGQGGDGTGMAEVAVVDQGIGIPRNELERIFERFYRVDPARHRATGGTGMGLSIVKHVAATHEGDVRVWSVEGQGSTFTLRLPRYDADPAPAGVTDSSSTTTATAPTAEPATEPTAAPAAAVVGGAPQERP